MNLNILVALSLVFFSCMVQVSSIRKLKSIDVCDNNTAILAISANYKMNMSSSKDVVFYLKDISSGKLIEPQKRDNVNNNLYFSVFPGTYKIALITIKEPTISKSIIFDDSSNKIIKTFGQVKVNQSLNSIKTGKGPFLSGAILTGDKQLEYNDNISKTFQVEANSAYYLGEYKIEGYIEGIFNDMPNIKIKKVVPASSDKLASFESIFKKAYPSSNNTINTMVNIFNTDIIDLSKTNAMKE